MDKARIVKLDTEVVEAMTNIVEVDTDGVLANMDGSYGKYIRHIIPDFTEEKYIRGWGMPDVQKNYPEAFEIVKTLWVNPQFLKELPRYNGVEEGMRIIAQIPTFDVVVHTHILEEGKASKSRERWLKQLRKDSGVDFDIDICTGETKKTLDNPYVTIEDNIKNLNRSKAKIKFLIRRAHNRDFTVADIINCEKAFVVNSFYDAAIILQELFVTT